MSKAGMKEIPRTLSTRDGATISYRVIRGDSPRRVIVLIHGMASNMTRWSEFVEKTELKDSWDLLRLDLRGHARSLYRGKIGMKIWCDDIKTILDHEGYEKAVLMGHCLGANIALHFANHHPETTSGLVLIEPMPHEALTGALKKFQPLKPFFSFVIQMTRLLNLLGMYRRHLTHLDLQEMDRQTRVAMAEQGSDRAMLKRYAVPWHDLKLIPSANYFQEFLEVSRPLPPLTGITVPVLALLSSGKRLSDPNITRRTLEDLPDCRIVMLDAHHWIPTEKPGEMMEAVQQWCGRLA